MDIQARKIEFVREFLELQNEELLSLFEKLLHSTRANTKEDFSPMSQEELGKRIDQSMEDSRNEKLTNSSDLMNELKKWK